MTAFWATLARDLLIARREGGESLLAVIFFVLGAMLFPLGVGPEGKLLALMAAGVIWVNGPYIAALIRQTWTRNDRRPSNSHRT